MAAMSPDDYAAMIAFDVDAHDTTKPRAMLTDDGHIGMSSLRCREQVRRILIKQPASDSPPKWKAIIGTALDEQFEAALREAHPNWWFKTNVTATLPSGTKISGTLDWADPDEPSVTDLKTKDGLALARRTWDNEWSYRAQRHLLGYGLAQQHGWDLAALTVRNVVVDRSGKEAHPFVWQEPFDMQVVHAADEWLADVFYAIDHGEEASRDVAGHECSYCPFVTSCRGSDIALGPITVPRLADAVNLYGEAKAQRDEAKSILDGLRDVVLGVNGYTDDYKISTSKVNATNGSQRITVRPL
jgi:hypothetical protein